MKRARVVGLLLGGLLALVVAGACSQAADSRDLEGRAQAIDKGLMCPICPSETINQSNVELAQQMRAVVREKLAEGWTEEQIQQFFVARYGEDVLAAPPAKGFNLVAWLAPPVGIGLGLVALYFVLRAMRRPGEPTAQQDPDEELDPYLRQVDRELSLVPSDQPEATGDGGEEREG